MIKKPLINANDTAFTRDLKQTIGAMIEEMRANRIQGDNSTFRVSRGAGGTVGHAIAGGNVRIAKITADNADGTYDATEQQWNVTGGAWEDATAGITWDGTTGNKSPVLEVDELTGIAAGTFIEVVRVVDAERGEIWAFSVPASALMGVSVIGGLTVATGAVTATVTTISGATLASQSVAIEGAANGVTFNSGVTVFCILSAGVWTAIVDVWDYHQDLPDYDGAENQALVHEAGTLKWLDLGCDS